MKVDKEAARREYFDRTGLYTPLYEPPAQLAKCSSIKVKPTAELTSSTFHELPNSIFVPRNLTEKKIQILDWAWLAIVALHKDLLK